LIFLKCENCGHEIRGDARHEPYEARLREDSKILHRCIIYRKNGEGVEYPAGFTNERL